MGDRKAELERKKARLMEIRGENVRKRKELGMLFKEKEIASEGNAPGSGGTEAQGPSSLEDVDKILSSLNIQPMSEIMSSLSSARTLEGSLGSTPDTSLQAQAKADPQSKAEELQMKRSKLTVSQITQTNIPPQERVTYSKEVQTAQTGPDHRDSCYNAWLKPRRDEYNLNPALEWDDEFAVLTFDDGQAEDEESSLTLDHRLHKLPPGILPHGFPQVVDVKPALTPGEEEAKHKEEPEKPKDLSEEEKETIMVSQSFQKFFDKSTRILERALCEQQVDIFVDYSQSADGEDATEEKSATKLSLNRVFYDEKWTKNRAVTCLDWSAQYPELLVASYSNNEDVPHDPDGACVIWNTKFVKPTPEFVFHCQSSVTSTAFARFHPNLVLGGTYSGSIVLWDNRVEKKTPVQRSPLTASAHTHPVYCLKVVGTQNSHNVISISTDGKLCSWSLDMLAQPQEILDLHVRQNKSVTATCLTFPQGGVNNFVIGSEEGSVYSACRHGTKTGIMDTFEGHHAPVTGISSHSVQGSLDFSNLFLTSSFDWTVKLWSYKEQRPIYSFDCFGDHVYDLAWSPIHPSVFAAVDGSGRLDVWNLNNDTELPTATVLIDEPAALNRVSWTSSGHSVTVGDDMGRIWIYDVGEKISQPKSDEWSKFSKTLVELRNNQIGEDLDNLTLNR